MIALAEAGGAKRGLPRGEPGEDPGRVAGMIEYYVQHRLRGQGGEKDCPLKLAGPG